MDDLVERLLRPESWRSFPDMDDDAPKEAAAEIQRLRKRISQISDEKHLERLLAAIDTEVEANSGFRAALATAEAQRDRALDALRAAREHVAYQRQRSDDYYTVTKDPAHVADLNTAQESLAAIDAALAACQGERT